ncbi:MAG: tetratricopeptide repeat protein [Burkholderiales bacterium]|nr:tetratricopeptide repeat protein [Burkholderiales bacterium]
MRDLIQKGDLARASEAAVRLHAQTPRRDLVQRCLQAEIAFRQGRDDEAQAGFKWVLGEDPGYVEAHYGLSLMLFEQGQPDAALRHAQFAANAQTQDPRYFAQLGLCHVQLGNYPIAEGMLRAALRALPDDKTCWNNLGIVHAAKGDGRAALEAFEKALAIDPHFENARRNLELLQQEKLQVLPPAAWTPKQALPLPSLATDGAPWGAAWREAVALHQAGRHDEALRRAEALAGQWPDEPELAVQLGKMYAAQGDSQGGIETMLAFVQRHPQEAQVLVALGQAYSTVSQHRMAEICLRRAVESGDDSAETLACLAEVLHMREHYAEAADMTAEAMAKLGRRSVNLIAQLAAAQVMACRYEEALQTYEELFALRGKENNPALGGYSLCITYLGRYEEAERILDHMLAHNPNEPSLRVQRFQMRLLHENYEGGWEDYLYRGLSYSKFFRVLPFPRWQGEPLEGKRIIVLAEQGLGDQVMFASCLPDLLALGPSQVYVEAIHRVAPTLARSFPSCVVIPTDQNRELDWVKDVGEADYYVPLGDLPARFRRSKESFPATPYLLPDPVRVAYWREQLQKAGPGPYIGVSWRGGTELTRKVLRSFSATMLAPLATTHQATWINLQYGEVAADIEAAAAAGMTIHHWGEAIADLDEFAALIGALDAVLTVCNTTVHYAGALGKKVWVLAPHIPEWRYGLHFERMPWYADVTVMRQPQPGAWEEPVARASSLLGTFLAHK